MNVRLESPSPYVTCERDVFIAFLIEAEFALYAESPVSSFREILKKGKRRHGFTLSTIECGPRERSFKGN